MKILMRTRTAPLFPSLKRFLVSLEQLCNIGKIIILDKHKIVVYKNDSYNKIILQGNYSLHDRM